MSVVRILGDGYTDPITGHDDHAEVALRGATQAASSTVVFDGGLSAHRTLRHLADQGWALVRIDDATSGR